MDNSFVPDNQIIYTNSFKRKQSIRNSTELAKKSRNSELDNPRPNKL